ncbi:NPCBM/NEW2 domain-containing protein [Kitasatospora sp. NPDC048365]|uniref:NPCBM/NEW2 domain-containing protein n=1 Tax=Kitasatospora sp. NPDC048365 TaxID=3364050 RepID=UPI003722C812
MRFNSRSRRRVVRLNALLTSASLLTGGLAASVVVQVATAPPAAALTNGLALTPPMGWNSWNKMRCMPTEQAVRDIADTIVATGLRDAGYEYVNIDDCWQDPSRDSAGNLVADHGRFPGGIKTLADYVHGKGLKLGIYATPGLKTCAEIYDRYPGQLGSKDHEVQDANTFASWGVDYLKYDWCKADQDGVVAATAFPKMRDALKATGRPILFSIHDEPEQPVPAWRADSANAWRTTGDINASWGSVIGIAHANQPLASLARPGAWNDPDMLEVGNGSMTDAELRTHFSLWAEMAAPLLMGNDLTKPGSARLDILGNRDVIAVDQDPLGQQGAVVSSSGGLVVMTKPLADGSRAVTLTNETGSPQTVSTTAGAVGIPGAASYTLTDLWSKQTTTSTGAISASVASHDTVIYRVTPSGPTAQGDGVHRLGDLVWAATPTNGWGQPERNRSNGETGPADGGILTVNGTTYARGLGVHAGSEITYHLGGTCTVLSTDVGVDDEVGDKGSVRFQVYRDQTLVADSGVLRGTDPAAHLTADLTGGSDLTLKVTNAGDGGGYDHADWAAPVIGCGSRPTAGTHPVSDLSWEALPTNGWGQVEVNRSNGGTGSGDGRTLTVNGTTYAKGLGTNATSRITYYLGGTCTNLSTDVGIDDEVGNNGSAVFKVYADGTKVAESPVLTGAGPAARLSAPLGGALEVTLEVTDAGDTNAYDHADWAGPVITCG